MEITDDDIERLARAIRQRVLRYLRKHGKLPDDDASADDPSTLESPVLQFLGAASVQGRIALGPNAGADELRLGRGSREAGGELRRGELCGNPNRLLLSVLDAARSDLGVYVSPARGVTWHSLSATLPTTPVHDLFVHPRDPVRVIGTHGRSAWALDVQPIRG